MASDIMDISIVAEQQPGTVRFDNFEELRGQLQQVHDHYLAIEYGAHDVNLAKRDLEALRSAKRVLAKTKKALKEGYTAPFSKVEAQLDELIGLLKEPESRVNALVKDAEREAKRFDIETFAAAYASDLGEHARPVLESPAFFNPRWLNATYLKRQWQDDVTGIIDRAAEDISNILMYGDDVRQALLARYYETLDMAGVERFLNTLQTRTAQHPAAGSAPAPQGEPSPAAGPDDAPGTQPAPEPQSEPGREQPAAPAANEQLWYMDLRVKGTAGQMRALLAYLGEQRISFDRGASGKLESA